MYVNICSTYARTYILKKIEQQLQRKMTHFHKNYRRDIVTDKEHKAPLSPTDEIVAKHRYMYM